MDKLVESRRVASRIQRMDFVERHPEPVLLLREVIEGDMQFADPAEPIAKSRHGNTMVHVPRMTASQRLRGPRDANRSAVSEETFSWIRGMPDAAELPIVKMGRARDCGIRLTDFTVSEHHCTLYPIPSTSRVFVEDNDSRNGTLHNGEPVGADNRIPLLSGDELQIGRFVLLFLNAADFYAYLRGEL